MNGKNLFTAERCEDADSVVDSCLQARDARGSFSTRVYRHAATHARDVTDSDSIGRVEFEAQDAKTRKSCTTRQIYVSA